MPRLEYRLVEDGFPGLFHYTDISKEEIGVRFSCDYFIKNQVVYEKTSTALEDDLFVIYVERSATEIPHPFHLTEGALGSVLLEIREVNDDLEDYPIIKVLEIPDLLTLLLYLQSNYINLNHREWEKTSAEIDEDRFVYVLYVKLSDS